MCGVCVRSANYNVIIQFNLITCKTLQNEFTDIHEKAYRNQKQVEKSKLEKLELKYILK